MSPPAAARAVALAAANAVGADLVGVDLLPLRYGSYTVLELNGAVEFTVDYGLDGGDMFEDAARALGLVPARRGRAPSAPPRRGRPLMPMRRA
jgi:hypothetical protein